MRLLILAAAATVLLLQGSAAWPDGLNIWEPIKNLSDPYVQEIAEFAVKQHNEAVKTKLVLSKVVKGETVNFLGTSYKLVVEVEDGADLKSYEAVVWTWKIIKILLWFIGVEGNA
ncbi:hypothetical protein BT93_E1267 [Corymbia citriodora subsp. variegata]|nr:hypothetical protein BT93_E1267 [Corymbia citriodora subsp. variegata]